ncbi:hypothetical protein Tco_0047996, partial [Tanacetum coccineum]
MLFISASQCGNLPSNLFPLKLSMLSLSQRDSNLLKFCIDDGIGPVNWLPLRLRKVKLVSLPVK